MLNHPQMLERFSTGLINQLQAEVDSINELVMHHVTKGSLNEQAFKRILASFLPSRYSLGSGFVIDSFGSTSKQVDILIFDEFFASRLFRNFSQVLFPVETVYACLEIKTSIDRGGLEEVTFENEAIAQLKNYEYTINTLELAQTPGFQMKFQARNTRPPLTGLVVYRASSSNPRTIRSWFEDSTRQQYMPDFTLFLDIGVAVIRPNATNPTALDFLVMPARESDSGKDGKQPLYSPTPNTQIFLNGRAYRSSEWKGQQGYPIVMPEKALLNFLIQLARVLDAFPKLEHFDPARYILETTQEGLEIL